MTPISGTNLIRVKYILTALLSAILLAACASSAAPELPGKSPTLDMNAALTQAVATILAGATRTAQAVPPTIAPTQSPTPIRTPPALPAAYVSPLLNPLDTPHTYIQDSCAYLKARWDPANAVPGTVLMPIMFHSITKGLVTSADQISLAEFRKLMNDLHEMGFQAVNMQQAADFLYNNAKIPQRSVLLIVDDRKYRAFFDLTFKDYFDKWGWKVVNAWISLPGTIQQVWDENAALEAEGWVDHQAHGVIHNINMDDNSTDEFLKGELQGSIDAMQTHFNKTPIAIVWPGGGFGLRPVQAARKYGYKLGFTINPRGPLMFNWVPLNGAPDAARPSYIPDGPIGDPLMTLPRYWDSDARSHIDTVRNIGDQAVAYAAQNKVTELEYYDILCAPTLGPMPQP